MPKPREVIGVSFAAIADTDSHPGNSSGGVDYYKNLPVVNRAVNGIVRLCNMGLVPVIFTPENAAPEYLQARNDWLRQHFAPTMGRTSLFGCFGEDDVMIGSIIRPNSDELGMQYTSSGTLTYQELPNGWLDPQLCRAVGHARAASRGDTALRLHRSFAA